MEINITAITAIVTREYDRANFDENIVEGLVSTMVGLAIPGGNIAKGIGSAVGFGIGLSFDELDTLPVTRQAAQAVKIADELVGILGKSVHSEEDLGRIQGLYNQLEELGTGVNSYYGRNAKAIGGTGGSLHVDDGLKEIADAIEQHAGFRPQTKKTINELATLNGGGDQYEPEPPTGWGAFSDPNLFPVQTTVSEGNGESRTGEDVLEDVRSGYGGTLTQEQEDYIISATAGPIAMDLDGDGVEIAFSQNTSFDWDGDGYLEHGSWASADDGFLVLDLAADGSIGNGDGLIDQAEELVWSFWGNEGDTDLQALRRAFDDNGDGRLNAQDSIWSELRIWQDLDQDGETEGDGSELKTLTDWGITQINLTYDGYDPASMTEAEIDAMFADEANDITVFGNTLHGLASYVHDGSNTDLASVG